MNCKHLAIGQSVVTFGIDGNYYRCTRLTDRPDGFKRFVKNNIGKGGDAE